MKPTVLAYLVALAVACLIVATGIASVHQLRAGVRQQFEQFREDLKNKKAAGTLPARWQGVDLDGLRPGDFDMQMPAREEAKLYIVDMLSDFGWVLVPLVFVFCLGVAALVVGLRAPREKLPLNNTVRKTRSRRTMGPLEYYAIALFAYGCFERRIVPLLANEKHTQARIVAVGTAMVGSMVLLVWLILVQRS